MLTEERQSRILSILEEKRSVTVTELKVLFDASESTIRRDIVALDKAGKLTKVFGGAVANTSHVFTTYEPTVAQKEEVNRGEKMRIARYAASLIEDGDFVYIDAGTTTAHMLDYLEDKDATFVTNAVAHAQRLVKMGRKVILLGGELKNTTEAVIGSQAMKMLLSYHFTKGFFGTNAVEKIAGFTTPDLNEAAVKSTAMEQCKTCYVLADAEKFDKISSVSFSTFFSVQVLTDRMTEGYEDQKNITIVAE